LDPGSAAGGLHPDRPRQGCHGAACRRTARHAQRDAAGGNGDRTGIRVSDRRPGGDGAGIQPERHRQALRPGGSAQLFHHDPVFGAACFGFLRADQFRDRHALRFSRPEDPLPLTGSKKKRDKRWVISDKCFANVELADSGCAGSIHHSPVTHHAFPSAMSTANAPAITYRVPKRQHPVLLFMSQQPLGAAGLVIIVLMGVCAAFAPWVAPYDPLTVDYGAMLAAPSAAHWLGTDSFGRDVLSRVIYGARTALAIGFIASFIGSTMGGVIGVVSAYCGGEKDLGGQGGVGGGLAFPIYVRAVIVLAITVVAILGNYVVLGLDINLIVAIAIPMLPRVERVVRASALAVRELPYVDAARAAGYSHARIVFRHMMPNVVAPYLIMLTAFVAQAILAEASLSFLGLGVTEPTPSWGLM